MSTSEDFVVRYFPSVLCSLLLGLPAISGCTVFNHEISCTTNAECTAAMSTGSATVPAVCVHDSAPHCAQLTSEDCSLVTGDPTDDKAVLIASLLSTTGAQAATNISRQQAAMLAVQEINASGGILQSTAPGDARKITMLSCDELANFPRVTTHLISELHVTAIVGPNLSQDMLDLTSGKPATGVPSAATAGVALLSPAAVASQIAEVQDNGLTYMMAPSDFQRVPLLKERIGELETSIKNTRSKSTIKLAIWYRDDALSTGTLDGLNSLTINGGSLAQQINLGNARQDGYNIASTDNTAKVASYINFKPDIIVISGTAEAVTFFVNPLEAAWNTMLPANTPKPYYITTDSTKVPDLLTAVQNAKDDLRTRCSGTGVAPPPESQPVFSAFQTAYGRAFKDAMGNPQPATQSGMGPAYDAVYTIALALVGQKDVSGAAIVAGIPRLSTNTAACTTDGSGLLNAPCFSLADHVRSLTTNMTMLLNNQPVTEIGTFGRLEWDPKGNKDNGKIEVWCVNGAGSKPIFDSSGLTYDVAASKMSGTYMQCPPVPAP
jgi:ABC-type branched-subunit amino acid transport system substrate-binding protein